MRLLILGGTLFLGRHLVDAALERGHEITLFNRGRTNPGLYPELETILGDRSTDLALLEGRSWDAVVDTSGYLPGVVRASAELLRDAVEHYTFISSISVYANPMVPGADESAPVQEIDEELIHDFKPERYGALKARCERAVEETLPGRTLNVRSGLLAGPHDPTGRLPYWIGRIEQGGEVLAPGSPERQVQLIHARDMAEWVLRMAEARQAGTFNVTGPDTPLTMGSLLSTIVEVTGSDSVLTWVPESFLLERGVAPWTELPLWLPEELNGMMSVDIDKARQAGLAPRPVAELVRDTMRWLYSHPAPTGTLASGVTPAGLSRERESQLLSEWSRR